MALLAAYQVWREPGEALEDYLDRKVFAGAESRELMAEEAEIHGFERFLSRYRRALPAERAALETLEE